MPRNQLIALRQQNAAANATTPIPPASTATRSTSVTASRVIIRLGGHCGPSMMSAAIFIEFPAGIGQGEIPPFCVIGAQGSTKLVNYRVQGNDMIVDRLFATAELRLGGDPQQKVRIVRTDGKSQS